MVKGEGMEAIEEGDEEEKSENEENEEEDQDKDEEASKDPINGNFTLLCRK